MSTFDVMCERLSRNSPECADISDYRRYGTQDWSLPDGYGPRLGQALRGNTCVEEVSIKLGRLLAKDKKGMYIVSSGDAVFDFLRQSPMLERVRIEVAAGVSDTSKQQKKMRKVVRKAVMAVAENPHAKIALSLCGHNGQDPVDVPPDTLARALRVTKSILELTIALGDGGTPGWSNFYWDDSSADRTSTYLAARDAYASGCPRERAAARTDMARAFGDNCSLKRLRLLKESDEDTIEALWPELRRNGSIDAVKDHTDSCRYKFNEKFAKKYWTRNRRIAKLLKSLSQATPDDDDLYPFDDSSTSSAYDYYESDASNAQKPPKPQRKLKIMPPVFAVVLHTPRMAGSRVLQGLLAFNEDMGHHGPNNNKDRKRAAAGAPTEVVDNVPKLAQGHA